MCWNHVVIRPATLADAGPMLALYRPYVEQTLITSEYRAPELAVFQQRIEQYTRSTPWLLCMSQDALLGYAYARPHREREGYQWTVETSIYVAQACHGRGIGRALYGALFAMLRAQGYYNVFVGITQVNQKSIAFHRSMGFETIGTERQSMYKFGKWNNTCWMHMALREHDKPDPPMPWPVFAQSEACHRIERQFATVLREGSGTGHGQG